MEKQETIYSFAISYECHAMTSATNETNWVRELLANTRVSLSRPTALQGDNQSFIQIIRLNFSLVNQLYWDWLLTCLSLPQECHHCFVSLSIDPSLQTAYFFIKSHFISCFIFYMVNSQCLGCSIVNLREAVKKYVLFFIVVYIEESVHFLSFIRLYKVSLCLCKTKTFAFALQFLPYQWNPSSIFLFMFLSLFLNNSTHTWWTH